PPPIDGTPAHGVTSETTSERTHSPLVSRHQTKPSESVCPSTVSTSPKLTLRGLALAVVGACRRLATLFTGVTVQVAGGSKGISKATIDQTPPAPLPLASPGAASLAKV